jgi:hypothetical protein
VLLQATQISSRTWTAIRYGSVFLGGNRNYLKKLKIEDNTRTYFSVILNEVKDFNQLKMRDSSLRSE